MACLCRILFTNTLFFHIASNTSLLLNPFYFLHSIVWTPRQHKTEKKKLTLHSFKLIYSVLFLIRLFIYVLSRQGLKWTLLRNSLLLESGTLTKECQRASNCISKPLECRWVYLEVTLIQTWMNITLIHFKLNFIRVPWFDLPVSFFPAAPGFVDKNLSFLTFKQYCYTDRK